MYETAVLVTTVLMIVAAADYVRRAWIRKTDPVPATWILMMAMIGLSFWMYWHSPHRSWTANIAVSTAVINIAMILAGVLWVNLRHGTLRVAFDNVQKWCLVSGAIIVVFWLLTNQPLVAYTLVQCIALVAYFATVKRLLRAERCSEPLLLWSAVLGANLCAVYPALVQHDVFAWIYLARAIPSTIFMVYLIARAQRRARRTAELQGGERSRCFGVWKF